MAIKNALKQGRERELATVNIACKLQVVLVPFGPWLEGTDRIIVPDARSAFRSKSSEIDGRF